MMTTVALVVLAADVITKVLAVAGLEGRDPVRILGGVVYLQLVRNPGAAFSLATGMTWLLSLVAIAVVIAIIWIARKLRSKGWAVGLALVLAGALGNLVDRLFREPGILRGHVVDFVSVFAPDGQIWPIFNIADSAIVVGAGVVIVLTLVGLEHDGTTSRDRAAQQRAEQEDAS